MRTFFLAGVATVVVAGPAFALDTPLPVPTVHVPVPVPTLPSVPTAVPTLPPVPTSIPTVVPVPTVRLPLPTVAPPALTPAAGGGSSGSTSSGSPASTTTSPGSSSGSSAPSQSSSSAASSRDTGSPAASSSPATHAATKAARASRTRPASSHKSALAERVRRRDKRLRDAVLAAPSCLSRLSSAEHRVLALRAGVGTGPPRSRSAVAHRLKVSVHRVAHLENAGLDRLDALARSGSCAGAATIATTAAATAPSMTPTRQVLASSPPKSAGRHGKPDNRRASPTSTPGGGTASEGGVQGATETHLPGTTSSGGINIMIPLLLVLLALAAWGLTRLLRNRTTPAPATGAVVAPTEDEPKRGPFRPARQSTMTGPGWTEAPGAEPATDTWSGSAADHSETDPDAIDWTGLRRPANRK